MIVRVKRSTSTLTSLTIVVIAPCQFLFQQSAFFLFPIFSPSFIYVHPFELTTPTIILLVSQDTLSVSQPKNSNNTYLFVCFFFIFVISWIWAKCNYEHGSSYVGKWHKNYDYMTKIQSLIYTQNYNIDTFCDNSCMDVVVPDPIHPFGMEISFAIEANQINATTRKTDVKFFITGIVEKWQLKLMTAWSNQLVHACKDHIHRFVIFRMIFWMNCSIESSALIYSFI